MNKIIIGAIAVICVVGLVMGFMYLSAESDNEIIMEHNDPNYTLETRIRAELKFADGTTEELKESSFPLALTHSGDEITDFTWYLDAKASTPEGAEAYELCEVYWTTPKDSSNNPFCLLWQIGEWSDNPADPNHEPYVVDFGSFDPAYIDGIIETVNVGIDDDEWRQICHYDISLEDKFSSEVPDGEYMISVTPRGFCSFAGKSGFETGEIQSANMNDLPKLELGIDWVGQQLSVNWNTRYEFTYK